MNAVLTETVGTTEVAMGPTETCVMCKRRGRTLGVWFVKNERFLIHAACWIAAYEAGQIAPGDRRSA